MNIQKLNGIIPASVIAELTPDFLSRAGIDGPRRLSNFMGQCMEESGNFSTVTENLNYSADGLKKIFGKYFPNGDYDAFARQPEKIANRVYANRMGNGNEQSGDGWKYRGRGYLQVTGKNGYVAYGTWAGIDAVAHPELLEAAPHNLLSAARYFIANDLWPICDAGIGMGTVTLVTKAVNGGTTNLANRAANTQKVFTALNS